MDDIVFRHSEVADPHAQYRYWQDHQPVRRDAHSGLWGVYSYAACRQVLDCAAAQIPPPQRAGLSAPATTMLDHLVRASNPPLHPVFRQAALRLMTEMRPQDTARLLARLVSPGDTEIDWVGSVCTSLPALAVMEGFGFSEERCACLLARIGPLSKIMAPGKPQQQMADIDVLAKEVWAEVERHACEHPALRTLASDGQREVYVANLVGLLIQSHDAGRGMLANPLLHVLQWPQWRAGASRRQWQRLVEESLRFDPPVHHTRRVLAEEVQIGRTTIPAGETVVVMLAAANRDPAVFERPHEFDPERTNNGAHLAFGAGIHQCVAQQFSTALAADALMALFDGREVGLAQQRISYEPLLNARLATALRIYLRRSSS